MVIVAISAVIAVTMAIRYGIPFNPDSSTYVDAVNSLKKGTPDIWRTPVYPAIIWFCRLIADNSFEVIVVALHIIVFLATIPLFFTIARRLGAGKVLANSISAVYAAIFVLSGFNQFVLTESLSASLTLLLLFCSIRFYDSPSLWKVVIMTVLLALLVFLRPAQIYLLPVFFIFALFLIMRRQHCIEAFSLSCGVFVVSALLGVYAFSFREHHGIFSLSCVNTYNDFYVLRQNGLFDDSSSSDSAFAAAIKSNSEKNVNIVDDVVCWDEITDYVDKFGIKRVNEAIAKTIDTNRSEWYRIILKRIVNSPTDYRFPQYWVPQISYRINGISIPFVFIYLELLIFIVVVVCDIRKKRKSLFNILLLLAIVGNFAVCLVGAKDDLDRLIFPSLPIIMFITSIILTRLSTFINHRVRKVKE